MQSGIAGCRSQIYESRRKSAGRNEPKRSLPVIGIDGSLAKVIVVDPCAPTNRSLARPAEQTAEQTVLVTRRVRHRNAWCDVLIIPRPISGFAIRWAGQIHGEKWIERYALNHVFHPGIKEIVQADARSHLVAIFFVRRLKQEITQAVSEGQIGLD